MIRTLSIHLALAELLERGPPSAVQRFPVALSWKEAQLLAFSPEDVMLAWCMTHGVGRGSVQLFAPLMATTVFYPPGWTGPHWTPELDVRWRALDLLAAYGERKVKLSRERLKRRALPRAHRLPRTLLGYGGAA